MGDHVCVQAPPPPQPRLTRMHNAFSSMNSNLSKGLAHSKIGRIPPARIDPTAASMDNPQRFYNVGTNSTTADRPFLRPEQRTPSSISSSTRSISPRTPGGGRNSSFRLPPRSATLPVPQRSPDFTLSQDCAFPPFPSATSRSITPKTPSEGRQSSSEDVQFQASRDPTDKHLTSHSRANLGENAIQRINKNVPGPFNTRTKSVDTKQPNHKRVVATDSKHESTQTLSSNVYQLSTSGSEHAGQNSLANTSGEPRSGLTRSISDGPLLSTGSALPRPFRQVSSATVPAIPQTEQNVTNAAPNLSHPAGKINARSNTFPVDNQSRSKEEILDNSHAAQIPAPPQASHTRGSSVAAANRPLHEIGSITSYKPFRTQAQPTSSVVGHEPQLKLINLPRHGDQNSRQMDNAPRVPISPRFEEYGQLNPYHTPTKSTSSNDSSGSEANSGSSRSSPPRSERSYHPRRKPSGTSNIDKLMVDIQSTTSSVKVEEEPRPTRRGPPPSFSRPLYARPADPITQPEGWMQAPESPMDPAIKGGRFSPTPIPTDRFPRSQIPPIKSTPYTVEDPNQVSGGPNPPRNAATQPTTTFPIDQPPPSFPKRRTTAANKGSCRGCNEPIKGKSVSSADGRLTGHYHKECFVCKTCEEPFQSTDFYVLKNHPYCSRHYHQLNGSLCKSCDRGIEGQYLETELQQKFHPQCFTCSDCRKPLEDDYFEMNGHVYCEQHAFRATQETSLLGPGRRYPERRTTRLLRM
ncbi:MAG: hypothetical protein Q9187_004086 [Circinaria calcarea]